MGQRGEKDDLQGAGQGRGHHHMDPHLTHPHPGSRDHAAEAPGVMMGAQTPPEILVWLFHIPPGDVSGTAITPRCGMMHVLLGNCPDFVKRHKAPKSGPKRSFSHRFALA